MKKLETLCVHPLEKDSNKGSVTTPIFTSTAYDYLENPLQYPGFYSSYNQERLGEIISRLERGQCGLVFSSGMAAISTAILSFVSQNDHVIFSKDLYGGTMKLAEEELPRRGIECSYAENTVEAFETSIRKNTKVIYLETPSNPLLKIVPLDEIATLACQKGIVTIVDNTFATPVNQLPILNGIDISVHSGTKYLGGHNDLPFGALVSGSADHKNTILSTAKLYGGSLPPYECYQVERSLKTLSLRVEKQNNNALVLAKFLSSQALVQNVYYPGLTSHPGHSVAVKQMLGFGGMLSFELDLPSEKLHHFLKSLEIIQPALSLGGVESLICSPAVTSHRYLSPAERSSLGIKDNLLRLSVGIEDADDLIADIQHAIDKASYRF